MSWLSGQLQSSLGNLKNQVASSLKEVFDAPEDEEEEEEDDQHQQAGRRLPPQKPQPDLPPDSRQEQLLLDELKLAMEKCMADLHQARQECHQLAIDKQKCVEQKDRECQQLKELLLDKEQELQALIANQPPLVDQQQQQQQQQEVVMVDPDPDDHGQKLQDVTSQLLTCQEQLSLKEQRIEELQLQLQEQVQLVHDLSSSAAKEVEPAKETNENEEELSRLRDLCDRLQAEVQTVSMEKEETRNEKMSLENECSELKEKLEHLIQDLAQLRTQQQMDSPINHSDQLKEELEKLQEDKSLLEDQLNDLKDQRDQDGKRVASLQADLDEKNHLMEEKSEEIQKLDNLVGCLKEQVGMLKERHAQQELESSGFNESIAHLTDKLSLLEQNLAMQEARNEELSSKLSFSSEMESLKRDMDAAQSEIDGLKDSLQGKAKMVDDLHEQVDLYKRQYESLLVEYNQYLEELEQLKKLSELHDTSKALYEQNVASLRHTNDQLQQSLEQLHQQRASWTDEKDQLQKQISHLEQSQKELQAQLESSIQSLREHTERAEEKQRQAELLQTQVDSLEQRLQEDFQKHQETFQTHQVMQEVMNEKSRELQQLRKEHDQLLHTVAQRDQMDKEEVTMSKETIHKLSQLIKDKDIEIDALKDRNASLVAVVQAREQANSGQTIVQPATTDGLMALTGSSCPGSGPSRRRFYSDSERDSRLDGASMLSPPLPRPCPEGEPRPEESDSRKEKAVMNLSEEHEATLEKMTQEMSDIKLKLEEKEHDLMMAHRNIENLTSLLQEKSQQEEGLQQQTLLEKAACQELKQQMGQLVREREDALARVGNKERQLQELRREVNNVIDKKKRLEQEADRLRQHLLQVEESHTNEALTAEDREQKLRKKLQVAEEALKMSSAQQSSVSKMAGAHMQSLESRLTEVTAQRDRLVEQCEKLRAERNEQSVELSNLSLALDGLQRDSNNDWQLAKRDFEQQLQLEVVKQEQLQNELMSLQMQLQNANEGLAAANRLAQQLDKKSQVIAALKQDLNLRDDLLKKAHAELGHLSSNSAGKVDKYLVKNLFLGYLSVADEAKKKEVLKVIATVVDFNHEERTKTGLHHASGNSSWLSGWLSPAAKVSPSASRPATTGEIQAATGLDLSLAQAFVKFLETESSPKAGGVLKLPASEMADELNARIHSHHRRSLSRGSTGFPDAVDTQTTSSSSSRMSPALNPLLTSAASPILSGSMASLPTFSVSRSSSSILKQVLHQEEPSSQLTTQD